jgi:hypothetical protein
MASWKITSDFPQLPGDNDANRIAIYQAVYAQLDAMGISHPATPAANISHDNMLKHLQQEAGKIVHTELQKAGYSGHTDADNAAALDTAAPLGAFNAPPIHDILVGFPFFPNAVTPDDVTNSK